MTSNARLSTLVLLVTLLGAAVPVTAYPRDGWGLCDDRNVEFRFEDKLFKVNGEWQVLKWTAKRKAAVIAGFKRWNEIRSPDGGRLVQVSEGDGAGAYAVYFVPPDKGYGGLASCVVYKQIKFNWNLRSNLNTLQAVAAHEMGHVVGLDHSGREDSREGSQPGSLPPVMFGCSGDTTFTLHADDFAAQSQRRGGSFHANSSFENGFFWWGSNQAGKEIATYAAAQERAPSGGPSHLRVRRIPATAEDKLGVINQDVRVIRGSDYRARASVKRLDPSDTGKVVLWTRRSYLWYDEDADGCYPAGLKKGKTRPVVVESKTVRPDPNNEGGWRTIETDRVNVDCASLFGCGAQISVSFRNAMYRQDRTQPPPPVAIDDLGAYP